MANRVVLGKRGSDYGLFISRNGLDVSNTSLTTPLSFNADAANSLIVQSYGQGVLVPNQPSNASFTYGGVTYTANDIDITHNLGYIPAFAVRWCRYPEISSGVATAVWSPQYVESLRLEQGDGDEEEENDEEFTATGGLTAFGTTTKLELTNEYYDSDENTATSLNSNGSTVIFYSYVIFHTENFKNGESL